MPTINLTNNTDIILAASSADDNATLKRYLKDVLTFKILPGSESILGLLVKDQRELDFPVVLSATGEGRFAVEGTTLDIQPAASASIGLLQGDDESAFFSALNLTADPSSSGLVSFGLTGTLSVGDSVTTGDFSFGITNKTAVSLKGFCAAAANDRLSDAVKNAAAAITIPHDLNDLKSLPPRAICQLDAGSSLKFMASATYSFLNDPLAAASIGSLPSLGIQATASATLEGTVTHASGHTLTLARLTNGLLRLAVGMRRIDDFETSLTVSAGVAANIGTQDALAFLLDKINPNAAAEADAIASQMKDAAQFKFDIKSAIDTALSVSLGASLKAALEKSTAKNVLFVYEIDLDGLDKASTPVLQAALNGDFTALTKSGAQFRGIKLIDSVLTVTATQKHTIALHFLGIFNAASIHEFFATSTLDFTSDTHEIVLSDERLQVVDNNLDAEKLRKLVLKDITLTLPASANTPDVKAPLALVYIDREGSTSPSKMRQFANVLAYVGAPDAGAAHSLLNQNLKHYGVCSLALGLSLSPAQCLQLFAGPDGANDFGTFIRGFCDAEIAILAGDANSESRLRLFNAGIGTWNALQEAGAAENMIPILRGLGIPDTQAELVVADVITGIWWATSMADYASALKKGQSLISVGKKVVRDANRGYNEPWMILAAWKLAGKPPISPEFSTSLPAMAATAHP